MTAPVEIELAHRLREAETEWLRRSADRIRAAQARPKRVRGDRAVASTGETR